MHEMGDMNRAQEPRVDEASVQNLCREVEPNYSGRLSHVSSQPARIPSSRSLLSRDKRLPLDTWNTSGSQENVLGNHFATFDSSRNNPQGIHCCTIPRERGSQEMTNKMEA